MSGGLSIGAGAPKRKISDEFPQIQDMFKTDVTALNDFITGNPLLSGAGSLALGSVGGLDSLINPLSSLMGSLPRSFSALGNDLAGLGRRSGTIGRNLGNLANETGRLMGRLPNFNALERPVEDAYANTISPVLESGGALTPEQERDVSTATGNLFSSRGDEGGNQAIATQLENRDAFRQARFNEALGQAGTASSIVGGLASEDIGLRSGILGQEGSFREAQSGILGQQAGLVGQRAGLLGEFTGLEGGLASGIQGLESGGINQLLAPSQADTGIFTALMNPLLSYGSNLFAGNQAASLSQGLANQNKASGLVGGSGAGITSILGDLISVGAISDKRLKTAIRDTGESTPEGIPIKTFAFKGDKRGQRFMGVIAQDVAKVAPHAVGMGRDGLMRVNFSAIHAPYHRLGAPRAESGRQSVEIGGGGGGRGDFGPDGAPDLPPIMAGGPSTRVPDLSPSQGGPGSYPAAGPDPDNPDNPPIATPIPGLRSPDYAPPEGLSPFTGTNPAWGDPAFGSTRIPTMWVNYPGVGLIPMAVPVNTGDTTGVDPVDSQ